MMGKQENVARKPMFFSVLHITIVSVAVLALTKSSYGYISCGQGEYLLENEDRCRPCPDHTYMPSLNHRRPVCTPVTLVVDGSNMRVITPYTKISDNVIICDSGYYKRRVNEDKSQFDCSDKCTNCSKLGKFEGRPCQGFDNTVCCDKQDMEVVDGKCKDKVADEDSQSSSNSRTAGNSTSTSKSNHNCTCQPSSPSKGTAPEPYERPIDKDNITIGILITFIIIAVIVVIVRERRWKKKVRELRRRNTDIDIV